MKCARVIYELLKIVLKHKVREFLHLVSNKYSFLVFQTYFRLVKNCAHYIKPFPLIETSSRPFLLVNRASNHFPFVANIGHLSARSANTPYFFSSTTFSNHLFPLFLVNGNIFRYTSRELINHNFSQTCIDIRNFIGVER